MASSSKRPRTYKSKQGESFSKFNLLNLTMLLVNDAQRKVFEENFHRRAIFTPKHDGEAKVALNLRESKVDIEVVHKMGFVLDHVTRRTYKHRIGRQTAPTYQPEPTAPNQLESHAPSFSSSAMPSNKMIMDELVSLRDYITTRMDAFDTQNQQINYELHRLSSRLSNMDVDEHCLCFYYAHNSKRKGEHTYRGIILKTSQDISSSMLLSEKYIFKKILVCHHKKGGDCEEDLAPDLVTVLLKTPTSQKEERKKTYKDYRRQIFKI
ncbi:hypothetical protein Lal_00013768 [Lupinus albus]|nr:hypothetical protein Lal_00013768 [Lupinus albus]